MPVKIRLQRHGKKGKPFYWIVAADARSKRDGRYLEKLGTYNPNTNPATVEVKLDHAVNWLEKGAQPTDTARTLLSYRGVMLKHHLNGGIRKGALSQEEANKKFEAWLEEKEAKIQAKKDGLSQSESELKAKRLANEKAVSDKRLADAAVADAEAAAEEEAAEAEAEEATTEVAEAVAVQTEALAEEVTTEEEAEQEVKETEATEEPEASAEQTEASEEKEE
ncbi:MAG: 30S ribosomal protein S16 [uncultured Bacteroidota bacterium]|nr:MAG: 30S ribosomal protein S16 [uncultured Bacteroidetes bacterium]